MYIYSSYNDMLPNNFIKYGTVRYIIWTFPFILMIIFISLRTLFNGKINYKLFITFLVTLFIEIMFVTIPKISYTENSEFKISSKIEDNLIKYKIESNNDNLYSLIEINHKSLNLFLTVYLFQVI